MKPIEGRQREAKHPKAKARGNGLFLIVSCVWKRKSSRLQLPFILFFEPRAYPRPGRRPSLLAQMLSGEPLLLLSSPPHAPYRPCLAPTSVFVCAFLEGRGREQQDLCPLLLNWINSSLCQKLVHIWGESQASYLISNRNQELISTSQVIVCVCVWGGAIRR